MSESEHVTTLYDKLQPFLKPYHLRVTASYLFGFMAGRILEGQHEADICLEEIIPHMTTNNNLVKDITSLWENMFSFTAENLRSSWVALDQMLPNAGMPLSMRLYSMAEFLEGFLAGIHEETLAHAFQDPDKLTEVLEDFKSITQMDIDEQESEENEKYFTELEEYIRVGVMLFVEHSLVFLQQAQKDSNITTH